MNGPAILDVEASGFGRGSYPVEVGYVLDDGDSQCMLVRPAPGWNHWNPAAEGLHRITRADLLEYGLPTGIVAEDLNHHLCGRTLYTDAWGHDYSWLAMLYDAAGRAPTFRLESLHSLLTDSEIARWPALKEQVATALDLPRHRACADARLLQATFGKLRSLAVHAGSQADPFSTRATGPGPPERHEPAPLVDAAHDADEGIGVRRIAEFGHLVDVTPSASKSSSPATVTST